MEGPKYTARQTRILERALLHLISCGVNFDLENIGNNLVGNMVKEKISIILSNAALIDIDFLDMVLVMTNCRQYKVQNKVCHNRKPVLFM